MISRTLPWIAAAAIGLLVPFVAGPPGVAYAPFWALAALPGVPLGLRITGPPSGWLDHRPRHRLRDDVPGHLGAD